MDYKPYSPEWHRKRYLKEALDKYFDDYVENEVIFTDMMDILSARMSAAVNEVNKVMDLKDKLKKCLIEKIMISPMSYVKNTRETYRKDLEKVITEVQVQFKNEEPAWIPYETLVAIGGRFLSWIP